MARTLKDISKTMFKYLHKIVYLFKSEILYVDSQESWNLFIKTLKNANVIGIDTEFDWRTTYFPKLSLIQVSFKRKIFIIDCKKIKDFKDFKFILENKSILKIFHSVRSDSTVLSNCLGITLVNVFDIQQAEKIITNGDIPNYASVVKKYFLVALDKSETNSNWLRRPLTRRQLNYAAEDVSYLIKIFNSQKKILSKKGLQKAFKQSYLESSLGNESFKKLRLEKKKNKFSIKEKEIFIWREELAESLNIPPNYIFKEKFVSSLAKNYNENDSDQRKNLMKIFGDSEYVKEFLNKFR